MAANENKGTVNPKVLSPEINILKVRDNHRPVLFKKEASVVFFSFLSGYIRFFEKRSPLHQPPIWTSRAVKSKAIAG